MQQRFFIYMCMRVYYTRYSYITYVESVFKVSYCAMRRERMRIRNSVTYFCIKSLSGECGSQGEFRMMIEIKFFFFVNGSTKKFFNPRYARNGFLYNNFSRYLNLYFSKWKFISPFFFEYVITL